MILSIVQIPTTQVGWRLTVASIVITVNLNSEIDIALNDSRINVLTLKAPITTAADDNFCDIFSNFQKNKV